MKFVESTLAWWSTYACNVTSVVAVAFMVGIGEVQAQPRQELKLQTNYWRVVLSSRSPEVESLSLDGLGKGEFGPQAEAAPGTSGQNAVVRQKDGWTEYFYVKEQKPAWSFRCVGDTLLIRSEYQRTTRSKPLTFHFRIREMHATLLGRFAADGGVLLPAILHLPGLGSIRTTTESLPSSMVGYDASRSGEGFVDISFPAAKDANSERTYRLQATAIFPTLNEGDAHDPRFDSFRRHYIDIFQLQARLHVLANNSASDPCPFTLYMYADMAVHMPPLAPGLTAGDLIRDTLDRYLDGFIGYGMPNFHMFDNPDQASQPFTFLDVYPSLLIAAGDYVQMSNDDTWLREKYPRLREWLDHIMRKNVDGSDLLEYELSGNAGSWSGDARVRPANWWDTIGFGHQDAYSNALAYRALLGFARLATSVGDMEESKRVVARALSLQAEYTRQLVNTSTGEVAGWRSTDGKLHDYKFTFVNGIAALYGVLPQDQAQRAMERVMSDFKAVGYEDFRLGIPGNLLPIRMEDYVDRNPRWGAPSRKDGKDGFQIYENGGATACFAYFTIGALYHTGHRAEADSILFAMLDSFDKRAFSGFGADGMTNDWKDWSGNAHGYEGFLVDSYYTLLAVLDREGVSIYPSRETH